MYMNINIVLLFENIYGACLSVAPRNTGGNTGCWPVTSWRGMSFVCWFTLEFLENVASDNNVSNGVSTVFTFKYSRSEKIYSMAGVSDITYVYIC